MNSRHQLVSSITAALALVSVATSSCGPTQQARLRNYEIKELHCLQQYRTGDVQTARQALLEYLRLIQEGEASHLPLNKTAWTKALIATRLALIYRHLGDSRQVNQYLGQAVTYAKTGAEEVGDWTWREKSDEQIEALLIDLVNKLDQKNTHPKWRREQSDNPASTFNR